MRLLTRSKQQGAVEVTGNGLRGRVFVGKGGIDLATTWGDDDLHRHLVNSGFAEESSLRRILTAETTLAAMAESNQAIIDLIREMTVESIYQIGHRGDDFEVHEGLTTPYASPKSFELESLLEDAAERKQDWGKVKDVVPDLASAINFRRDLGDREEVTVKVDDWKVLSEIGVGSSVRDIADHLGTTEFWTARVAARLVKNDLVVLTSDTVTPDAGQDEWQTDEPVVAESTESVDEYAPDEADSYEAADEYTPAEVVEYAAKDDYESDDYEADEPVEPTAEIEGEHGMFAAGGHAEEDADDDVDPDESWWQDPAEEAEDAVTGAETPEVISEDLSEMPAVDNEDSHVEEDTEAFLEKVFSELESSEPESDPEPEEEGHGLLRRRRMGTLRDFSSDS